MISAPVESYDDAYFWDGARAGELRVQRCRECGRIRHPPAPMCGACHSTEWDVQALRGTGSLYSWVVSRHPSLPDAEPRTVILVELDEGVRMVSNLVEAEGVEPAVGMRLEAVFVEQETFTLPQFRPVVAP